MISLLPERLSLKSVHTSSASEAPPRGTALHSPSFYSSAPASPRVPTPVPLRVAPFYPIIPRPPGEGRPWGSYARGQNALPFRSCDSSGCLPGRQLFALLPRMVATLCNVRGFQQTGYQSLVTSVTAAAWSRDFGVPQTSSSLRCWVEG